MADLAGVNGTREKFEVVGKPNVPGKLSYTIATGKAKFGIDYVFDNMLEAKFLRSPYANAMVKSVDVAAAKKVPGVVDVVTWEDNDLKNFGGRGGMGMTGGGGAAPKQAPGETAPKAAPKTQQGGGGGFGGGAQGPYVSQVANMEDEEVAVIVVAETEEACDEGLRALKPSSQASSVSATTITATSSSSILATWLT